MAKINTYQRELYHHGILGQKWGRRNGPPYPLDDSDHSAAEKKEGWRKSLGGGRNENLYDRKDNLKKRVQAGVIGTAAGINAGRAAYSITGNRKAALAVGAGTAAASGVGLYKGAKHIEKKKTSSNESDKAEKVRDYNEAYDKASELSDKSDEMFEKAKEIHKSLAKTPIGRAREVYKAQIGKGSEAAKEYSRLYDEASDLSDKAFDAWVEADKKYAELGKTYASRVINAAKYDSRNNIGNNVDKYIWDTRKKRR